MLIRIFFVLDIEPFEFERLIVSDEEDDDDEDDDDEISAPFIERT
jgi:hypothetical protein